MSMQSTPVYRPEPPDSGTYASTLGSAYSGEDSVGEDP